MEEIIQEEELKLTDIFQVELLQQLQDTFYDLTGLSGGISDQNGVPITKHRTCHEFCFTYTRGSELGRARCQKCDVTGQEFAFEKGKPIIYTCHSGLTDFAAPIIVEGRILGSFLGGQVVLHPLDEQKVKAYALELGIDPEEYWAEAQKVPVVEAGQLSKIANFLSIMGNMMSSIAYKKYNLKQYSHEVEKEAHMKSDFLANMSHEIRTPMNAVIGMAEMALREELTPAARDYIQQIKNSGNTLLTIINDVLDFSKISAGKMDINIAEYEPMSVIYDVSNIIMTRIGNKNVELLIDFAPDIPYQIMGDSIRIKQIIMNLANNAVKFTNEGHVKITVGFRRTKEHEILLQVSVADTGIGIKKEDTGKLFQSFQQVDSKRNRNVEGTGLGLAISKQLVELMNGRIWVESEYGKGSTFSFEVPQIVLRDGEAVTIQKKEPIIAAVISQNPNITESLKHDIERFKADCIVLSREEELENLPEQKAEFLFIDHPMFSEAVQKFVEEHREITCVLMTAFRTQVEYNIPNLLILKKPMYSLNIGTVFNHEDLHRDFDPERKLDFDFIAPDADILIVDDNELNLTVAQGLIEPLQMRIDTALSGREAIDKITVKHYDLVFMDHMMPELDGVETTHIIRRFHEEYNDVPIIALTANAVEEMKSMFLVEGMNDFIAKPIELRVMISKLKQWLPMDKIIKCQVEPQGRKESSQDTGGDGEAIEQLRRTKELDVEGALRLLGTQKLLWEVIKDFYTVIEKKTRLMNDYFEAKDWHNYTIEVHALKSAAKQIGANELSRRAAALEAEAKMENEEFIVGHHSAMIELYLHYQELFAPFMETKAKAEIPTQEIEPEELQKLFDRMRTAMEELDMDGMDDVICELGQFGYPSEQQEIFEQLKDASDGMDVDACEILIDQWISTANL